ncbi:sugar transferase [Streptomyces sp. BE147]|uniref:sugar transferase n=1 Tax=unclassified Streptomyces TaxID=2593676 RepID=UPI002E767CA1|nr:sugar transferase [Streptomyces sp. BE147]MEE1737894.1 sugar transferase [Streptomyces sp. BE147]
MQDAEQRRVRQQRQRRQQQRQRSRRSPYRPGALAPRTPLRTAARAAAHTTADAAHRFTSRVTAKRVLDLILGSALLILAAPALAAGTLALAVKHRSGGVLERRTRIGLHGRPFELRSLRTRRLRLDLLSRLPHVVRGDLSLVGPAPLAPGDPGAGITGARYWRHELRPGLTGLAQVRARSGMPWDEPALLDQHYAEHRGTVLDLAVLAESVHRPLRAALRRSARRGKAHLSDTDHRLSGYRAAE